MVSQRLEIVNPQGFHMRPANDFVREMTRFDSEVTLVTDKGRFNGKSLMNIIAAGLRGGSVIEVECEGSDENEMLSAACELISSGFGEI